MSIYQWEGHWRGQAPEGDVHRRAREVVRHTGGIVRGKFPSRKNGRMVHHEGLLELDAIYLFETSPRVAIYREQPSTIHYPDGPRLRRYTPDFELLLSTGDALLVEVKPFIGLADQDVRHKLDCVAEYLRRSSRAFVVLSESSLRLEPRQSNLRQLYHATPRIPPSWDAMRSAIGQHSGHFPMPLADAVQVLRPRSVDPYSLLLSGLLRCELNEPVTGATLLELVEEHSHAWFLFAQEHGV